MKLEDMLVAIIRLAEDRDREHGTVNDHRTCVLPRTLAKRFNGWGCRRCDAVKKFTAIEQVLRS